jgi:U32 family peptidase
MELVAPAGNLEKLEAAFRYGADSAYIGFEGLSLRSKADNFKHTDARALSRIKGDKRLYCALNIIFRRNDISRLESLLEEIADIPFDAFIISDPGVIRLLRRSFPRAELHLSTQASCSNPESAKFWRDLGFSRIIPSRELSLKEIEAMKREAPGLEIEVFVHGAMCVAYSGRCLLSAAMAGRAANSGACAHSCRWEYRLLEESTRPGQYMPLLEGDNFSLILSSKDLRMDSRLNDLRDAGVDALKIEGRMKSTYYVAATCQAYRSALMALGGEAVPGIEAHLAELDWVSHRPYSTGFFYSDPRTDACLGGPYQGESLFLALVKESLPAGDLSAGDLAAGSCLLDVRNSFSVHDALWVLIPGKPPARLPPFTLVDEDGLPRERAIHQEYCRLFSPLALPPFSILLRRSGPRG